MTRRLLTLALALVLLGVAGCEPTKPRQPIGPPPDTVPAGTLSPYDVEFIVMVYGPPPPGQLYGRPYTRQVTLTITAVQQNGDYAIRVNPDTGEQHKGPIQLVRTTPVRHGMKFGPGVVMGSVTALYLGQSREQLVCWVERDGVEILASRASIDLPRTESGRSGAEVSCLHLWAPQ